MGEPSKAGVELWQDALAGVQQQHLQVRPLESAVVAHDLSHEVVQLGAQLDP